MSTITFEGKIFTLQQDAYMYQELNRAVVYRAHATDEQDNDYTVIWQLIKYENDEVPENEEEMCDWDKYTVEKN